MEGESGHKLQNTKMQTERNEQAESNESAGKTDKRKRSENSSMSELETSILETPENQSNSKGKRKNKKIAKQEPSINENFTNTNEDKNTKAEMKDIKQQLKEVNSKLTSVINKVDKSDRKFEDAVMKSDGSLRGLLRDMMKEMKEELLNSVVNRLELLESKIYDRDSKTESLSHEVKRLEKIVENQKNENETLRQKIEENTENMVKARNDSEQYSRSNNIRIHGLVSKNAFETADETTDIVIKMLHDTMNINLRREDIDVAHRMKNFNRGSQEAIVKLQSRLTKDRILRNRKQLKGTGIFINEDLTQLNQQVLMSVKRKMPDEVNSVFSRNGVIKYVTKTDQVKTVLYKDYQHWLDLPWPTRGSPAHPERNTPRMNTSRS